MDRDDSNERSLPQALVGGGLVLLGLGYAWGATSIPAEAGYGGVGPNFLPWVVSVLLLACGGRLGWQGWTGGFSHFEDPTQERGNWDALAWISAGVLLNAAAIERIGFILSCALCFAFAVRGLRRSEGQAERGLRGTLRDLAIGAAVAAPAFWLFTKVLAVNLPGLTATGWL